MLPQPLTLDTSCSSYSSPALISLGEEYTDDNLPTNNNGHSYNSPISPDDEYDDPSPISPDSPYPPLWQEEHARLVHLHTAVLDDERIARDTEILLESKVARIKGDLARLRQHGNTSSFPFAKGTPSEGIFGMPSPPTQDEEAALSTILTEAREARAEQRQNRKRQRERIRELGVLLTLGTEVRKWEERLAWHAQSHDMDLDPRPSKRSSRSISLPSFRKDAAPLSPQLPPLSSSPLWRVSAEMILRRGSLSERPRRQLPTSTPPAPPAPAAAPAVQFRTQTPNAASIFSYSHSPVHSSVVGPSSAKRYPVPPPITIPPPSSEAATTTPSSIIFFKSAPSRPSALKWAFTRDDLMRQEQEEAEERKRQEEDKMDIDSDSSSSSSDSDSGDSGKSSSEGSDGQGENNANKRRGRARFSWRKSLTSLQAINLQAQLNAMEVDS